ncbi:hypothetical protein PTKIN_Ptkin19aG0124200 [Pterospermum kingtungense]
MCFDVSWLLVFEYDNGTHNVMQVNVNDFKSCNPDSPIVICETGSDAIPLESVREYYFLCGVPGHCEKGQKIHITLNSAEAAYPPTPTLLPNNINNVNVPPSSSISSKLSYQLAMVAAVSPSVFLLI